VIPWKKRMQLIYMKSEDSVQLSWFMSNNKKMLKPPRPSTGLRGIQFSTINVLHTLIVISIFNTLKLVLIDWNSSKRN
jgi:hypothetical protein